jgi:heme/copper-type cytochrome/quinol oxidase subunit 2
METPLIMTDKSAPTRLLPATLGKLTLIALVGLALCLAYLQAAIIGALIPPLAVFAVVSLVVAGVVGIGWRWAPALGALWSAFIIVGNSEAIAYNFAHPNNTHQFNFTVITLAVAVVGVVAGVSAAVQNYRGAERSTPRSLPVVLTALVALCLGAILVAAIPQGGASAGVSAEVLSGLSALSVASSAFDQQEIHAKVGETIALRLDNRDSEAHSFDIDELNVHAPMPARQSGLALFKPSKPGTYTFYCGIPAHRNLMVGKLIVEP